jgi:hypothetical protein
VILAAGLLVLLGLGLFVAGILTGVTALYWGCVAACVVAAVLLFAVRRQLSPAPKAGTGNAAVAAPESWAAQPAADDPAEVAPASTPTTAGPPTAAADGKPADGGTAEKAPVGVPGELPDPPVEEVEVTDLLLVVDLTDEVLVVDEHPRYHLAGCTHLAGRETIPIPLDEARTDGFTPCAVCAPDRNLAERVRARRAAGDN